MWYFLLVSLNSMWRNLRKSWQDFNIFEASHNIKTKQSKAIKVRSSFILKTFSKSFVDCGWYLCHQELSFYVKGAFSRIIAYAVDLLRYLKTKAKSWNAKQRLLHIASWTLIKLKARPNIETLNLEKRIPINVQSPRCALR